MYDWAEAEESLKNAADAGFKIAASVESMLATPVPAVEFKRVVWKSRIWANDCPAKSKLVIMMIFFIQKNVEKFSLLNKEQL